MHKHTQAQNKYSVKETDEKWTFFYVIYVNKKNEQIAETDGLLVVVVVLCLLLRIIHDSINYVLMALLFCFFCVFPKKSVFLIY